MTPPAKGGHIILAAFALVAVTLGGCVAPMSQREAQGYGALSLRDYCTRTGPCRGYHFVRAQRMGESWLLDYESDTAKYGVMVRRNGIAEVTVWAKS